ncbi:unnamed protein product, partial [Brenthis ino]
MLIYKVIKLRFPKGLLGQPLLLTHTATCPTLHKQKEQQKPSICAPKSDSKGPSDGAPPSSPGLKRALKSGKVRFGFLPEEWFLFFHSKTGVSGPYIFGIVFANYLFSKEIFVMDHEYYTSLSIFPMLYFVSTRLGPAFAKFLDKDIDEFVNNLEKDKKDEMSVFENVIKDAKDAQWRAEGQKILMDAKKEHIAMQLEAIYRERYMQVFRAVKNRLDYQVQLHRSLSIIQQKWMINWIIENVKKAITREFEKKFFEKAIQDISAIAGRT